MTSKGITRQDVDAAGGTLRSGSSNVFVNSHQAVRIGDTVEGHGDHGTNSMKTGSHTVFVNNKPVSRAGDIAQCDDTATGSSNVFAGD